MTLALIAGRGDLPAMLAEVQPGALVCGYEGLGVSGLEVDVTYRLETLGTLLATLTARGVTEVCFAGGIDRPALDPEKLDAATAPLVPLFMAALKAGDDGALRVVMEIFEKAGFAVKGAHEIAPDLVARPGVYGASAPDTQMRLDADVGARHIHDMSPQDKGQACIVAGGRVLAMEDVRGTDSMIAALEARADTADAILFKGPKQGQTLKIDMPTIGPETLEAARRAGLAGVVVDAGGVLVLHAARCTELADAHGLVFWARPAE